MNWPPCGDPACPVADPSAAMLRRLRSVVVPAASRWWRATKFEADTLVPAGSGDTRFAPLPATSHGYFGATRTVSLLESALHDTSGPEPTIYLAKLTGWTVHEIELVDELRLIDLRDPELRRLGLARRQLVDTTARHYPCTRVWATHLRDRRAGGHQAEGVIWHSRQADLHARNHDGGLLGDVLVHGPAEVAVVWHPHGPSQPFHATGRTDDVVVDGIPTRLLTELSALIGAPIE